MHRRYNPNFTVKQRKPSHQTIHRQRKGQFLTEQAGRCAICRCSLSNFWEAALDHDHETGKYRGVLCRTCNLGLGLFHDNVLYLDRAITYLIQSYTVHTIEKPTLADSQDGLQEDI